MTVILWLPGTSLCLGVCGLTVFLWSLRTGQYDDLDGAAARILFDQDPKPENSGRRGVQPPASNRGVQPPASNKV